MLVGSYFPTCYESQRHSQLLCVVDNFMKMCYVYTMRKCSGVNKDEIIKFECIRMGLEKIILNKVVNQT